MFCEKDSPQMMITVSQGSEVIGYVVIDSTVGGRSFGGLRMLPDIDEAEMRELARATTLKNGFLGLPKGGAKAVVRYDPDAPQAERWQRLVEFGYAIAPILLSRIYVPAPAMGTDNADIRNMLNAVGIKVKHREHRDTPSGYYTALTVFSGAKQAIRHLCLSISDCKVAIEGFGKVGRELARLFAQASVPIVAVSTSRGAIYNSEGLDVKQLVKLAGEVGGRVVDLYTEADRIDRSTLLELPVDLLCPCARHHNSIRSDNVDLIKAKIICPGANNPITPEAERTLFDLGVLCLPDFVTNSGGVLGGTMEFASINRATIEMFIENHIGARISWLLREATRKGVLPRDIAMPVALRRFNQVRQNSNHHTLRSRFFAVGLELYRRGWIPRRLVAHLSLSYFEKSLA